MAILAPHSDRAVQEYRHRSGARDTYWLNELVKYVRSEGLYDSFRLYPFMPRTNADSGSTAFGLGGLTTNEMTLVNGPTWGASGLAFASASSQHGIISDFLGSETLTVFCRSTIDIGSGTTGHVGKWDGAIDERGWLFYQGSSNQNRIARSSTGTNATAEFLVDSTTGLASDTCFVISFPDLGESALWANKASLPLTTSFPKSNYDAGVDITYNCFLSNGSAVNFADQTAHALAFITGTLTTAQRETITDLINMIGKPPPLEALREYVAETGATDTLTLDRLTRYVSDEGLWDNFALYSMMPDTNYNSGSSVKVLGGLTTNDMTLVNGPTWGASGLAFASASSQYGSIPDFLGSETLTVFARVTPDAGSESSLSTVFGQFDTGLNDRSFVLFYRGDVAGDPYQLTRSDDGTALASHIESYQGGAIIEDVDLCLVAQWVDGGGRSFWQNKSAQSLTLSAGDPETSRKNSAADITLSADLTSGNGQRYADQTAHALAFVTGTLTTAQRETITDLINEL